MPVGPTVRAAPTPTAPGVGTVGSTVAVVLIVEDDPAQRAALERALSRAGYPVAVAATGTELRELAEHHPAALVLVDLGLPDVDGIELCRRLAVWPGSPIIVVSGDGDERTMVAALDAGATDFVAKPFRREELLARVRAALRERSQRARPPEEVLTVGDVVVDASAHEVTLAGRPADFSARQFSVLEQLMRNEGRLVTHAALTGRPRGEEPTPSELGALRIVISRVRKLLGTGPDRPVIATEAHVGYRLLAPES